MPNRIELLRDSPLIRRALSLSVWVYFAWLLTTPALTSRWLDFPVYWEAGLKAAQGHTVYDVVGHFQYKYSPLIAYLFGKVFGIFPFETASLIFQKGMLILWFSIFVRVAKGNVYAIFCIVLFFGNALRLDLALGQMNAAVFALLWILFTALDGKRSWRQDLLYGVLFSIAVQMKLFAFILLPALVFRREWRKLALGVIFVPLLSWGGIALVHGSSFALAENQSWMRSLFASTDGLLLSETNVGLLGIAGKIFGLTAGKALWMLSGLVFGACLFRERSRPLDWLRARLFFAIALFNPLVWSYWVLYALPLFMEGIETRARNRAESRGLPIPQPVFVLGTALTFVAWNSQHARWAWQGGILAGLFFLLAVTMPYDVFRRSLWSFPSRSK